MRGNAGKRNPFAATAASEPVEVDVDEAPTITGDPLAPPSWLSASPPAVNFWRDSVVPILRQLPVIKATDHHGLARWAYWMTEFVACVKVLKREGRFQKYKTTAGSTLKKDHPAIRQRDKADERLHALEMDYPMTTRRRLEIQSMLHAGGMGGGGADVPLAAVDDGEPQTFGTPRPKPGDLFRMIPGGKGG